MGLISVWTAKLDVYDFWDTKLQLEVQFPIVELHFQVIVGVVSGRRISVMIKSQNWSKILTPNP